MTTHQLERPPRRRYALGAALVGAAGSSGPSGPRPRAAARPPAPPRRRGGRARAGFGPEPGRGARPGRPVAARAGGPAPGEGGEGEGELVPASALVPVPSSSWEPPEGRGAGGAASGALPVAVLVGASLALLAAAVLPTVVGNALQRVALGASLQQAFVGNSSVKGILGYICLIFGVRFCLQPCVKFLYLRFVRSYAAEDEGAIQDYDKSIFAWLLQSVYGPLEVVVILAAAGLTLEDVIGPLLNVEVHFTQQLVYVALVAAVVRVLLNWETRFFAEISVSAEAGGQPSSRFEGTAKLLRIVTIVVGCVLGMQAVGFDINSLLAVGGISGLALGLAGRELLENIFMGFLIYASEPFLVGEEITFSTSAEKDINGIVQDIGLFRTAIRSWERNVFYVPNSVFSRSVVMNISRKERQWRFNETLMVKISDVSKVRSIVSDIRGFVRRDDRVIKKLHRRIFLDSISENGIVRIFTSFYVSAANRDQYLSIKEDVLFELVDIIARNQAELAVPTSNIILTNEDALRQASGHDDYEILAETIMAESQAAQRSVDIGEEVEGQRNEGGGGLGDEAVPSSRPGIDTPPITPTSR